MNKWEVRMWDRLQFTMGNCWFATRVENRVTVGFPDIVYSVRGGHGYLELKSLPKLNDENPYISLSKIAKDNSTRAQIRFLNKAGLLAGGMAFMLFWIRDNDQFLMLDHHGVMELVKDSDKVAFSTTNIMMWTSGLYTIVLEAALNGSNTFHGML